MTWTLFVHDELLRLLEHSHTSKQIIIFYLYFSLDDESLMIAKMTYSYPCVYIDETGTGKDDPFFGVGLLKIDNPYQISYELQKQKQKQTPKQNQKQKQKQHKQQTQKQQQQQQQQQEQ